MSLFQYVETRELQVGDPLLRISVYADTTYADIQDIGFFGQYYDGSNLCYTGLFRDASDSGTYKLFTALQALPTVSDTLGLVNTGGAGYTLANLDVQNFKAFGNIISDGNLTVSGITATFSVDAFTIEDNIIAVGTSAGATEDFGYVGMRSATNVSAGDSSKINNVAVQTNYVAGSITLLITNTASGIDYFKGWVITNNIDGLSVARIIEASTNSGTTHTLTLNSGFVSNLTAGIDTIKLFNKRHVGWIYDESTDVIQAVGFPRETGETKIDVSAPVNGNVPDYINVAVNNLVVNGSLTLSMAIPARTKTVTTDTAFTQSDIFNYDIIFIDKSIDGIFTLPQISSLAIPVNTAYITAFININSSGVPTIARSGVDTIEGKVSVRLIKLFMKIFLIVSDQSAGVWLVKG